MAAADLIPIAVAGFTAGGIVTLLIVRRPPRHCVDCGEPLSLLCAERAACNRRREAAELQRVT